jgi:hypothetical protein
MLNIRVEEFLKGIDGMLLNFGEWFTRNMFLIERRVSKLAIFELSFLFCFGILYLKGLRRVDIVYKTLN